MAFKMSETSQILKVYNLRADTFEFIGAGDAYVAPHTGLPAYCTDIEPPEVPAAHVAVFDGANNTWSQVEDHRGKVIFHTSTGAQIYVTELGPLPANTTSIAPDGQYQKWNGSLWSRDEEAERAAQLGEAQSKKNQLMRVANSRIAPLQDAVDLGIASNEETQALLDWKKYRVLLNRIDTSTAPDIEWTEQPAG